MTLEDLTAINREKMKDIRVIGMISNKGEVLIYSSVELTEDEKKYIEQLKKDIENDIKL